MEFKTIENQINDLEYQEKEELLTAKGLMYLKELRCVLKQRNQMIEILKIFTDFPDEDFKECNSNNFYTFSVKISDMIKAKKIIKESTN